MININIDPMAFWNVRWYGIMIAAGILVMIFWMMWQVRKGARISYDTVFTAALVGIPSGVVFSRLLHVIDNIVVAKLHPALAQSGIVFDYTQYPAQIIGGAGLTIWGAVLGAALGIWIYSRFSKLQFSYFANLVVPGVILAQAVGRVGCTINGCCYGLPTSLPWAFVYTQPQSLAPLGVATQPVVVYEIMYLLVILGVVMAMRRRLKPDGSLFLVYLSLYSLWRFGSDYLRGGTPFLFGLHQAQVISIVVLLITIPLLVLKTRWVKAEERSTDGQSV